MKLWSIETQDGACLLVFHDVMVSTFKFGGNRRFFGVDTADFVGCRGSTRAIRLPVVCDIPVSDITWYLAPPGIRSVEKKEKGREERLCVPFIRRLLCTQ